MQTGELVKVVAPGVFYGYVGAVTRITQSSFRRWYWVVFDDHPWQKPGVAWSFSPKEVELHQ